MKWKFCYRLTDHLGKMNGKLPKVFHRIIETVLEMDENFERWYFLKFPFWQNKILKAYTTGLILKN